MSRNSDYTFVSQDTSELKELLIQMYESLSGKTLVPGSPESVFVSWVLAVIQQERAMINYAANQNLPSRAEGENLDALGDLFYLKKRLEAKPATTTMKFYISEAQTSAVLIPKGTRVTDASQQLYWETDDDAYVTAGSTYVSVPCTCMTAGAEGNGYAVGQINNIVDVFTYYSSCENTTESANGSDRLTDDEYYEYLKSSMAAYSTAGSKNSYIYHAKSVSSEIKDVIPVTPDDGEVVLYAIMEDGSIAPTETKNAILVACSADDVRPLTDKVTVDDPDEVTYNINVTYYLTNNGSTMSASAIREIVMKYVDEYKAWQSTKMGRDINPSYLTSLLMQAGVKRVVVTSPVYTVLSDGSDGTTPEIAKIGTTTVTDGGYENE